MQTQHGFLTCTDNVGSREVDPLKNNTSTKLCYWCLVPFCFWNVHLCKKNTTFNMTHLVPYYLSLLIQLWFCGNTMISPWAKLMPIQGFGIVVGCLFLMFYFSSAEQSTFKCLRCCFLSELTKKLNPKYCKMLKVLGFFVVVARHIYCRSPLFFLSNLLNELITES